MFVVLAQTLQGPWKLLEQPTADASAAQQRYAHALRERLYAQVWLTEVVVKDAAAPSKSTTEEVKKSFLAGKPATVSSATTQQPAPVPQSNAADCWLAVIEDMRQRREFGIQKYGTPVQPNNGRDALLDAYQEVLDTAVYLKQALLERAAERATSSTVIPPECSS